MDEIICPICGRANTLQAENCRYCQAPLDKPATSPSEQLFEPVDKSEFIKTRSSPKNKTEEDAQNDEDVPEWLKRIRELKKADDERELEKEKWRQQTLFGQENHQTTKQEHRSSVKKSHEITSSKKEGVLPEEIPSASQTIEPVQPLSKEPVSEDDKEAVDPKGGQDLPEGYEPLPSK